MKLVPNDLPALIEQNGALWQDYEDLLFNYFCADFLSNPPTIQRLRIGVESKPEVNGKHRTFWHLISEGAPEPLRTVCPRRCERICWPRHMIVNAGGFNCWLNERPGRKNVLIATENYDYVVVLVKRRGYLFLWTAYCVEFESRREALKKEHEAHRASLKRGD